MYWISGLHDACIIGTESFKFPFDYNEFVSEKIIYNRYLITLRINANGALYDNEVKEIRIFNYRILLRLVTFRQKSLCICRGFSFSKYCYIIKSQTASAIWDFQLSAFAFDELAVDIKGLDLIIFNSCDCERYGIARL